MAYQQQQSSAMYQQSQQLTMRHMVGSGDPHVMQTHTLPRGGIHDSSPLQPAFRSATPEAVGISGMPTGIGQQRPSRTLLPLHWDTRPATMARSHSAQNIHEQGRNMHIVNISFDGPSMGMSPAATMSRTEGRGAHDKRMTASTDGNWIFRAEDQKRANRVMGNSNTLTMRNITVSQQLEKPGILKVHTRPFPESGGHVARASSTGGSGREDTPSPAPKQRSKSHDNVLSRGGDRIQVHGDFRSPGTSPGATASLGMHVPAYHMNSVDRRGTSPVSSHVRGPSPTTLQRSSPSGRPPPHNNYAGQIIYMQQTPGSPAYAMLPQPRYIRKIQRSPSEASSTHTSSSGSSPRTPTAHHQGSLLSQVVPAPGPNSRPPSRAPSRSNSVPDLVEATLMEDAVFEPSSPTTPGSARIFTGQAGSPGSPADLDLIVPPPPSSRKSSQSQSPMLDAILDPMGSIRSSIYSGTFVRVNVGDFTHGKMFDEAKLNGRGDFGQLQRRYNSEPSLLDALVTQEVLPPDGSGVRNQNLESSTMPRAYSSSRENASRTVALQKGDSGFGFVLRGAKDLSLELAQTQQPSSLDFAPSPDFPALQYLDRVDRGSMADKAGLKPGDFVLEINGESVVNATHEHTVQLIKRSGDTLAMKVITVKPLSMEGMDAHMDGTRTLPIKKKALRAPAPPKRHPHTSLTTSGAGKAKSMLDSLAELERLDRTLALYDEDVRSMGQHATTSALDAAAARRGVDPNNKTASIRSRHSGKRLTTLELEDIFARQGDTPHDMPSPEPKPLVVLPPKAYASPAEQKMARMRGRASPINSTASLSRARSTPSLVPAPGQQQVQHVTRVVIQDGRHPVDDGRIVYSPQHMTASNGGEEVLYAIPLKPEHRERHVSADSAAHGNSTIPHHPREPPPRPPSVNSSQSEDSIPPPPTHPPPAVPGAGELVRINVEQPTYANVSEQIAAQQALRRQMSYESSFRPGVLAKLSKEPAALPPGAMPPQQLSHSTSSSSSMSSSPDHYGRPPPASSVQMRQEQSVIRSDASSPPSTHDSVHENARRFMLDHPTLTSETSHHPAPTSRAQYYEPEPDPDYETVADAISRNHNTNINVSRQSPVPIGNRQSPVPIGNRQSPVPIGNRQSPVPVGNWQSPVPIANRQIPTVVVNRPSPISVPVVRKQSPVPDVHRPSPAPASSHASPVQPLSQPQPMETEGQSVKSIRERWQQKQGVDETDRTVVKPSTPTSPNVESATTAFGNAIKAAAIAREKRQEEDKKNPPQTAPAPLKKPSGAPPPPPPPGPPPPPPPSAIGTPPSSQPSTIRKVPAHIQKSLEENRQREDTHAAIMAAVARRRNLVENENMEKVADSIENKVQKGKKIQSTVYRSGDKPKEVISSSYGGVMKTVSPTAKTSTTTTVESSVAMTEVVRSATLKMEEKREEAQRPPEETKSQAASAVQTAEGTNFTAMAEKARQEWLLKKSGQTLERKKKDTNKGDDTDDPDNNNSKNKSCAPPPPIRQDSPSRNGGPGGMAKGSSPGTATSPGMGDLAAIIAQKAAARQKSYESNGNSKSNGNLGNGYGNIAALGVNTNSNNKNTHQILEHRQSLEIQGATMDSSNTESVAKRTQIFESQRVQLKKASTPTGSKTVYRAEGSPILPPPAFGDDSPPPMVPPPQAIGSGLDIISNGHSRNGQETVGWVINSANERSDRSYSLQGKLAQRNNGDGGGVGDRSDVSTMRLVGREDLEIMPSVVADVVEMDFIPPPPFFDSPEMNAIVGSASQPEDAVSMVSSLSTLSTLSSTEQDGGAGSPRVSHHSNSYTINHESDTIGAPPPPGFDDILEAPSSSNYGQPPSNATSPEFIPPPMGFDFSSSSPQEPLPGATSVRHVMRRRAYQEKSIDTWSTVDVCEWLESLQLGKLSTNFAQQSIAGQQLMKMGRSELISIGVTEVSDRMNIERAIKRAIMRT